MADEPVEPEQGSEDEEFGSCCAELKEAMSDTDGREPLIAVGEDGVLYMSVAYLEMEGEDTVYWDHPVFFCPFCGTELQAREDLRQDGDNGT